MKKIFSILFITLCLIGCIGHGKVNVNYDIIYPDTIITYDSIFDYHWCIGGAHNNEYNDPHLLQVTSNRGTNYMEIGRSNLISTTCPIRVNSYKIIDK